MMKRRLWVAIAIGVLGAPGSLFATQNPGPDLVFLDSLLLEETDDHYVGNPMALQVTTDGSLFVSDGFSDAVLHYNATGMLIGHLGGKGDGPGEFRHLGGVGFASDEAVGFLDEVGKLEVFVTGTGAHVGSVKVDLDNRPSSFTVLGDSLWFAGMNPVSSGTFGAVGIPDLMDAVRVGSDLPSMVLNRGQMPVLYAEEHALARSLSHAFIDVGADDVILGFTGSPFLMRSDRRGAVKDTLWISPPRERRGEPDETELLEVMAGRQPTDREALRSGLFDVFGTVSLVRALSRDDTGNIYTLHQDADRGQDGTMTKVRLYVAVSSADGSRQCSDTLVPTSDVGVPIPVLRGRTLWILEQQMSGGGAVPDIATVVRRFRIDAESCTGSVR